MAKFFHIIYKALVISLLAISEVEKGLFRPILSYFATIETNKYGMLYLHYLVWLKQTLYLATLRF